MNSNLSKQALVLLKLAILIAKMSSVTAEFLSVKGKEFYYGEEKVFLSGSNIAWNDYARDFGNGMYETSGPIIEKWIKEISKAGGNIIRIWIHIEGQNTPEIDQNGFPISPDKSGTLISDLSRLLDFAADKNVFVVPVLWNGAIGIKGKLRDLVMDDRKLEAYLKNVLVPMVSALKFKPALAAWEIMNEPEGSLKVESNSNPCFDTVKFKYLGAGWTNSSIPMKMLLRFVNRHSASIKMTDPKALVTLGSWSHYSQTDEFQDDKSFNYYKDKCLEAAGDKSTGTIDFYQMHAYSWQGNWATHGPFKVTGGSYNLDKPVVIGEFSAACSMNEGVEALWDYGYYNGYAGLWSWMYNSMGDCSDTPEDQIQGMQNIRNYTTNGKVAITIRLLDSEVRGSSAMGMKSGLNTKFLSVVIICQCIGHFY